MLISAFPSRITVRLFCCFFYRKTYVWNVENFPKYMNLVNYTWMESFPKFSKKRVTRREIPNFWIISSGNLCSIQFCSWDFRNSTESRSCMVRIAPIKQFLDFLENFPGNIVPSLPFRNFRSIWSNGKRPLSLRWEGLFSTFILTYIPEI